MQPRSRMNMHSFIYTVQRVKPSWTTWCVCTCLYFQTYGIHDNINYTFKEVKVNNIIKHGDISALGIHTCHPRIWEDQEFTVLFNYIDNSLGYLRACLKSQKAKFKNNHKCIVNMRAMSKILHGYYSTECSEGLHGGATVSPILDK